MQRYRNRLGKNIGMLEKLMEDASTAAAYPHLSKYLRAHGGSAGRKLIALHELFIAQLDSDTAPRAEYSALRKRVEQVCTYENMVKLGGSMETWKKLMPKLCTLGMVNMYRPREHAPERNTQGQCKSVERAHARAHRYPATWWSMPRYTKKLLREADTRAATLKQFSGKLDKDGMRDILGTQAANAAHDTGFDIHPEAQQRRDTLLDVIDEQISARGYTTKDAAFQTAYERLQGKGWNSMWRIERTYDNMTMELQANGIAYRKPTKEEHARYGLTSWKYILVRQG